ncbi:EpsG family protein [Seonamhaeicola aphaedonensis]|uniref:EpsG-like putative glucosyltransferase n=1 Tax=Seonamhaeicola aphaedonensis TaxID=1461338 RepID=A0A3D9HIZ6_9FLAO|nr:EpsG family protein [Seonamhaeicola aphaedonensis]RED48936.1 EpsG-like putative glucosyltransferase [Seonamhaeicola aphaedonensis]
MTKKTINNFEVAVVSITIFLINPFIGVMSVLFCFFFNLKLDENKLVNLLIIFLSIFLSFINLTKIPENDLMFHSSQYLLAEKFTLMGYLGAIRKEPLGYAFNYLMYYISGGSVKVWVLTFSLVSYSLFFFAIKKFYYKIQFPLYILVLALVLGAFLPQLFSLSAHLIRQFIASCIFIHFAIENIFYGKNRWWMAVLGVLMHASSLLLYSFIYFKFLGDFKKYGILNTLIIIALFFYQSIAYGLLLVVGGVNDSLDYILERANRDTHFDLGNFQFMNFIMMAAMIIVALTSKGVIQKKLERQEEVNSLSKTEVKTESVKIEKNVKFFFSTMIILSFFIVLNLKQSELSNRLFFYLFFYLPFVIPLFLLKFKQRSLLALLMSTTMIVYFTYRLEFGVWTYAPLSELVTNSFFSYINYPEPTIETRKIYYEGRHSK